MSIDRIELIGSRSEIDGIPQRVMKENRVKVMQRRGKKSLRNIIYVFNRKSNFRKETRRNADYIVQNSSDRL